MDTLYTIAARGNSTRFPRKHFADVCGRPLLWYTLDWVRRQGIINETILATDDQEYADYAEAHGVKAVVAPSDPAGNTWKAIAEAVRLDGRKPARLAHLNPCAPLRPANLLTQAHELLTRDWDGVLSIVQEPTWRHYCYPNGSGVVLLNPHEVWRSSGCLTMIWADRLDPIPERERDLETRLRLRPLLHAGPVADVDVPEDIAPLAGIIREGFTPWTAP